MGMIEFMIATATSLVIIAGLYNVYIFQDRTLDQQDRLMKADQNARFAMDMLTDELRHLGLGIPEGIARITAADYQSITFLVNFNNVSAKLTGQAVSGAATLTVDNTSGFASGQTIYISDGLVAESKVLASNPAGAIDLPSGLGSFFPTGSSVNVADTVAISYDGANFRIKRQLNADPAVTLASGVDYMQFKYYDANGNELGAIGTPPPDTSLIRRVKILIVTKTDREAAASSTVNYENGTSKTDGYQRIYLESDIRLRNML